MRLTLRTLLAYMDDILDPVDQEDLARQVAESEAASELIHRTRDATRRLRLGAPPVIGEGMELDPNQVAEYLDNTMSPDDMTEFQQVCLDSDVHLAEVASCHHVLTMVLGEPAEIDPEMRERMYQVPASIDEWRKLRLDSPHREPAATGDETKPVQKSDSGEDEPITEVPDYLKASESSTFGRLALAFAAALVLGFGAFMLFGPGGILAENDQLAESEPSDNGGEPGPAPKFDDDGEAASGTSEMDAGDATATPDAMVDGVASDATTGDALADATDAPPTEPSTPVAEDLPPVAGLDSEPALPSSPDIAPETPDNTTVDGGLMPDEVVDAPPTDEGPDAAMAVVGDPASNDAPGEAASSEPDERIALNTDVDATMLDGTAPETDATQPDGPGTVDLVPPDDAPMGTLVATKQILLRWDELSGQWLRMSPRASVAAGNRLLSLPTYRPSLALVSGLRVEMCDGAAATFDFADDGTTPRLEVTYGRFLLHNTDMAPIDVEVGIAGATKRLRLESTAVLGVEIDRPFVSGADVEAVVGNSVATFYAPGGKVTWNVGENSLPVVTPAQWAWEDVAVASITNDISWLDGQSLDYLLQNVSRRFEEEIDTSRPARLQLLELYETSRRREEKALAAKCGTHVGQFVPFVQALADTQQQSNWDEHIDTLRQAMSRGTQAAQLVHDTLTKQRGADLADDLFAMLRGYTPEQIGRTRDAVQSGVTRQLIDWLAHDRLEYRVLAIHNLRQIYGGKTLGYNPVITEPSRQERAVKMWRTRLSDNELLPSYLQ